MAKVTFPLCREIIISHTGNSQGKDSLVSRQIKCSAAAPIDTGEVEVCSTMAWDGVRWDGMKAAPS